MRVVTWNCNGALARKLPLLDALEPDVLVIQEASERDIAEIDAPFTHWIGKKHRGLAVIGRMAATYRIDPSYDPTLPWFVPLHVNDLRLLAVWASVLDNRRRYVRLIHEALDRYSPFLHAEKGIIAGDLNSNTVFDRKHGSFTHTRLVERLDALNYTSLWHIQHQERHGEESRPTFFLYRKPEQTWHLDYAFLSSALIEGARIEMGSAEAWLPHSDHLPLIVDIPTR